jgi:O-antigen/teichoic acid export membrane protein
MLSEQGQTAERNGGSAMVAARGRSAILALALGAKKLGESAFLREFLLFTGSTLVLQGARLGVGLIAARLLGPATYGQWNALSLILMYGMVVHVGVLTGFVRDVPLFKGKGDVEQVKLTRRVVWGVVLCTSLLASLGMVVFAVAGPVSPTLRAPVAAMALFFFVWQLYDYLTRYLKSDRRFASASYKQFVFAALLVLLAVPMTFFLGLAGYILGQAAVTILVSVLIARRLPFSFKPKVDWQETCRLVRGGAPILVTGLLGGLLITVDRFVILSILGVTELGYYSLTIMVVGFGTLVTSTMATQIYPRMAEEFGRTASYATLRKWVRKQAVVTTAATAIIVCAIYLLLPGIVYRFLPAYAPGIGAVTIILVKLLFVPLQSALGNCLVIIGKQVYDMLILIVAVAINAALAVVFARAGMGIWGVALASMLSYAAYTMALALVYVLILRRNPSSTPAPQSL